MNQFFSNYLEVNDDFSNCMHKDLKKIKSPFIVPISYDYANSNFEMVLNGRILCVSDKFNNIGFYVNPNYLKEVIKYEDLTFELDKRLFKSLRELKLLVDILEKLESIDLTIEILKANHQYGKLTLIKEHLDTETQLRQVGVFDQSVKIRK